MNKNTSDKTSPETRNQTLTHEDGMVLLCELGQGLAHRESGYLRICHASETCRSVTEKLTPYYEAFPDIREKAEDLVSCSELIGFDDVLGGIDIYPEAFEALAEAESN